MLRLSQQTPQAKNSASRPFTKGTSHECGRSGTINLAVIGPLLRAAREKNGTSVAGAAEALFVKKSTLVAIESGHWETLPHPVYVKGYVKSYASYLGALDTVETHFHVLRTDDQELHAGRSEVSPGYTAGGLPTDVSVTEPRRLVPSRFALFISSLAGLLLGLVVSPGIQATPVTGVKDMLVACHLAIADMRRVILP
jgi:hypothetical protein